MHIAKQSNMKSSHQLLDSEEVLLNLIRQELENCDHKEVVIMAGHYMLFMDEVNGSLTPGVMEEQENEIIKNRIKQRVGIFPHYTWTQGVKIAEEFHVKFDHTHFLLLINDWQYVPTSNVSASELRQQYYDHFTFPKSYLKVLKESGIFDESHILSSRKQELAFPETWLKYRFQKSATKLVKENKLEKKVLNEQTNETEVSFLDQDGNYKTLISCGVTGCAGEITEMISEVYKSGKRLLLMFAPGECYQPVKTGVEIALDLYSLTGMKIIIADPGGSGEMSIDEIYSKMVNFSVFQS
ncbi:LPD16 domain-containing protein [Caldalkalibacillus mannanilyticus]|uniref:LPD16 domain-containing protein n=1 Tax=Caldalkalibacillus mannanilyticus TaxID=1418 RepID=UPI00046819A7|nr:LPD16 domain-containing protein [Caldalkalibacillus mannanilyticus]